MKLFWPNIVPTDPIMDITRSSADADNALDANEGVRISDGLTAHTTLTKAIKYSNI